MERQVLDIPSIKHRFLVFFLLTQSQDLNIDTLAFLKANLNLRVESEHEGHELQVSGQWFETPSNAHLALIDAAATHSQLRCIVWPSFTTLKRKFESTQADVGSLDGDEVNPRLGDAVRGVDDGSADGNEVIGRHSPQVERHVSEIPSMEQRDGTSFLPTQLQLR